ITAASNAFLNPEKIVLGLDHDGSVLSSGIFSANWTPGWETVNGGDGQTPLIDYSNSNYVWTATQNSQPSISSTGGSAYTYVGSGFSSTNDFSVHYAQNQSNPTILYAKKATNIGSTLYEDLLRSDNRGYSSSLIEQISDFKNDPLPVIGSPYFIWNIIPTPNDPNICYVGLGNNVTWDFKLYKNDQMLNPSAAIVKNNWVELNDNNNSSLKAIDNNNNTTLDYTNVANCFWTKLGTNLPNVPATGLEINYQVNKLRVATAGRGIWEHDLFCPSNSSYAFTAAQNTSTFYEAVNQITSTSTIGSSATITYRGGTYVDLNTGFLTTPNSANYSEMFIHPCSYAGNSPGIKAIEQEENTDGSPDNPIKDLGWMSSELELYPNPNDGKFTVSVKTDLQYEVTVFSSMGQLILTIPSTEVRNMEIDLSAFPKGIYLINFSNNHDFKSVKVICK
ncbi:MAG: T9SS type A sorting domain-containing protein, partial [Flavobacteriia bacterium]|nr:T9SS type A sorting domain-containing protein [Flavobacteriia bacterium]